MLFTSWRRWVEPVSAQLASVAPETPPSMKTTFFPVACTIACPATLPKAPLCSVA
nr:hypothetical protein [Croceibacterium ferulae]